WVTDVYNHRVLRYSLMLKTAPDMGLMPDSTMDEDTISNSISVTVTDINEQALTITYTSSDTSLISPSGIIFSGDQVSSSGGVYTVTTSSGTSSVTLSITPESNQSGTCSITITVTDPDGMTATDSFSLTINAVDDAPYIASIDSQILANSPITFTITDDDGGSVEVTASSSDSSLLTSGGMNIAGSGTNNYSFTSSAGVPSALTLTLTPVADQHGLVTITVGASIPGGLTDSSTFTAIVGPPGSGNALEFDGTDDYVSLQQNYTWPTSFSTMAWIYLDNFTDIASIFSAGQVSGSPADSIAEFRIISSNKLEYLQDNGSTIQALESNTTFVHNKWYHVAAVKNGSTVSLYVNGVLDNTGTVGNNLVYTVNVATGGFIRDGSPISNYYYKGKIDEISFWSTVLSTDDIRHNMCQRLTGTESGLLQYYRFDHSSGTSLVDLSENSIHGTLNNMDNADWVLSGAALGDDSAFDYTGTTASDFAASLSSSDGDRFTATGDGGTYTGIHVYLVNESPNTTTIPDGYTSMDTDHYYGVFPVGIIPTYSIAYNYTGNSYAADDSDLQIAYRSNNAGTWTSFASTQYSTTTTLVKTGIAAFSGISATEFILGKNEPPMLVIVGSDELTTNEDTAITKTFTITDAESSTCGLSLSIASSDSTLFTDSHITYACSSDEYIISMTPAENLYGFATITIIATDAGGLTASDSFSITVVSVNDVPVIASDSTLSMNEDATASFTLTATDVETANCSLDFTYTSFDAALISIENISYTCASGIYYLTLTPTTDQSGNTTLTITVTDGGGLTAIQAISLTVTDMNDSPLIGLIADQTTLEDIATSIISFTATDNETATCDMSLTLTSSDQSLIPDDYILSICSGNQYSIVATPAMNQYGTAIISVTITDAGGLSSNTSFSLTVTDVDDSQYMWTNNQAADVVLGQTIFTSNTSGATANTLQNPVALAIDPTTGKVFISDRENNRVLRFSSVSAGISGSSAEAVFGQADFTSVQVNRGGSVAVNTMNNTNGLMVDTFGRLWVSDRGNNRILRFDNASSRSSGTDADAVLGQPDFTTNTAGTTQNKMNEPHSVWLDPEGRLWVADFSNHRVLRFDDAASKANGANADAVLGQSDFTSATPGLSQSSFNLAVGVFVNNSDCLFVADLGNNRVLRFDNASLKSNGANADSVLGQTDFVSNTSLSSETNIESSIHGLMDNTGRLYLSDFTGNRVLVYNDVLNKTNGAPADHILGQPDFTSNTANNGGISGRTLYSPHWLYFDNTNHHLWIGEYSNNRVLRFTMLAKTAPVISSISDSTTNEDTVSNSISFTVTDINEQALTITYMSSNESLISSSGIAFSGDQLSTNGSAYTVSASSVATTITLSITPETNQSGTALITITVTDPDGMTAIDSFSLTVTAVNDAPTIETISGQTTDEEVTIEAIPITITDAETSDCSFNITIASSDTAMIPVENISYTCSAGIYYLYITPTTDLSGSANLTITVEDPEGLTGTQSFVLNVNDVNDAPFIATIADQTTLEDIATSIISFTATDLETATCSMALTMTSSDPSLLPDEYILSMCSGNEYSIVATPAMNQYGTATISVTITDAGGLSAHTSFNLTITDSDDSQYMWVNHQAADVVLGQNDFTSNTSGTTNVLFNNPTSVAVDPTTGKVFVSDRSNFRVLRFSSTNAAINGSSAEAVFGQADFVGNQANRGGSVAANTLYHSDVVYVDSFGHLWVSDRYNHRVLRYDNASSKTSGSDADGVLGQPDFTTNTAGTTQSSMNEPTALWVDPAGRLWVADLINNRVLRYDNAATKPNGANADGVLGQTNFTSNTSGTTQNSMSNPHDIFGDNSNTIFIVDYTNNRVLRFNNAALKANGANADGVLGQSDFTSSGNGLSINNFNTPLCLTMDFTGRLYVSDMANNRVLLFNDAINKPDGANADNVLGQPDFTSNTANNGGISETSLDFPHWSYFDPNNHHLWLPDYNNNRVLRYTMMLKTAPEMSQISDSSMNEDTVSNAISFTVTDVNEQALSITYTSSDTSLISTSGITFSGDQVSSSGSVYTVTTSSGTPSITLSITPEPNQSGTCSITITVTDSDGMTATDSFNLTVNEINDPPQIGSINNQTIDENTSTSAISFTITDIESNAADLTVTAISSDTVLLPDNNISLGGSGITRTVTITPAADESGSVTITISVSDGSLTATISFNLTVINTNDAPVFTSTPGLSATEDQPYDYTLTATDTNNDTLTYTITVGPSWLVKSYASFDIDTYAGTGSSGNTGDGSAATSAQLNYPTGVAVDSSGNLYISDRSNGTIRKVDATTGNISTFAGTTPGYSGDGGQATSAQLNSPYHLAFDSNGDLFVAEEGNDCIRKIDISTGDIITVAGKGSSYANAIPATQAILNNPNGIAFDSSDNMYISENYGHIIRKVDNATGYINTIAGTGTSGYSGDGGNALLAEIDTPVGIAINSSDILYFADRSNSRIRKIDLSTNIITNVTTISNPTDIAFDSSDNIYISSCSYRIIRKIDVTSDVETTVAGIGGSNGYSGDGGPATSATFECPYGIASDSNDNFYIADFSNHAIRIINPTSTKITGTPLNEHGGDNAVTVEVSDGTESTSQSFTITVANVNDAPVALASSFTVTEDSSSNAYTLTATDEELDSLTYSLVSNPTKGSITIINASSGACLYTPNADEFGEDTFTFKVNDGQFDSSAATITVNISSTDDAPVITSSAVTSATEGQVYDYTVTISNVDGDALNYTVSNMPSWVSMHYIYDAFFINTIAGRGSPGYFGDGQDATLALFDTTTGIAIDSNDNIYISDKNNHRIRKVDAITGIISTFAGVGTCAATGDGGPATAAELCQPYGLAIDSNDNVYVGMYQHDIVRKIEASTGTISTYAGNGSSGFGSDGVAATSTSLNCPVGLAFDSSDNLYIADYDNHRIRKVDQATGIISTVAGTGSSGYSGDDGQATSAQINSPWNVGVDLTDSYLYIADRSNNRIRRVNLSSGVITHVATTSSPTGIGFDSEGNIYVSSSNDIVQKIDFNTLEITTVAGIAGNGGYSGDHGLATSAQMDCPFGIAVDSKDNIYFPEFYNHVARKISPSAIRISGTPTNDDVGDNGVTIEIDDGTTTDTQSFTITVINVNTPPEIASISDQTLEDNTAVCSMSFTVSDDVTAGCSLSITYATSNPAFLSVENISYTCSAGTFYFSLTPATNQSGTAYITMTISDSDGVTASTSFVVSVNFPPELSTLSDLGTSAGEISFTLVEAEGDTVSLTVTSSDQSLISDANILINSSAGNSMQLTTSAGIEQTISLELPRENNVHGLATITVTASAAGGTVTETFNVIVSPAGSGNALLFDGDDDFISFGSINGSHPLALAGSHFSMAFWFKPAIIGDTFQRIIDKSTATAGVDGYVLCLLTSNRLRLYVTGDDRFTTDDNSITPNIWQHVAITADGSQYKCYINGVSVGITTANSYELPPNATANLYIGTWYTEATREYNGQMDEFSIWNKALSETEVREYMCKRLIGNELGLVAYFRFDHTTGTTLTDLSGNAYHGTLTNMDNTNWITSGSSLGDTSIYDYTGSVASDFSISLSHSDGDAFTVFGDSGTYSGIHIYMVDEAPSSYTAPAGFSSLYTDHYFGVFPVGYTTTYSISYHYTGHSEIIDDQNLQMASRSNNGGTWVNLGAGLDTSSKTITKTSISAFTGVSTTELIPGINNIPDIESIADQTTDEDTTISIPISITDTETATCSLNLSFTTSDSSLISIGNMSYTCSANKIYLSLTPSTNQSGSLYITTTVTDAGAQTSEISFGITVTSVNDIPAISSIEALTSMINTTTNPISVTVTDDDGDNLTLTGNSSDTSIIANENMSFSGTTDARTITITPTADMFGTVTITVTVSDAFGLTSQTAFSLFVSPEYTSESATYTQVSAGMYHAVALKDDGSVWAWGFNSNGQLGDGTNTNSNIPNQISNLDNIVSISAGDRHSMALKSDGTVWICGSNSNGQIGDGTTTHRSLPVQVSGLNNVIAIKAGAYFSMALKNDGTVWTWGSNVYGQLGDNTTTERYTPVQVSGLSNVTGIAAAKEHALALKNDGTVWAWGLNTDYQLGDGTNTQRNTPVQVSGLSGVTAIDAKYYGSIALKSDGTVRAWGKNGEGQLGDGTTTVKTTLIQPSGLSNVTDVSIGRHSMALINDGTIKSWGWNAYGQLGDNSTTNRSAPVLVSNITDVTAIDGYYTFSMALKNDGTVWTCGKNDLGQLGDGTNTNSTVMVQVLFDSGAIYYPVIRSIADTTINEDELTSIIFTAADLESSACMDLSITSSNQSLLSNSNISYTCNAETYTLSITPTSDQSGVATISVMVTDSDSLTATRSFSLTVNAINDTHVISSIGNQTIDEDTAITSLSFTVTDAETAGCSHDISFASSNTTLIPVENISYTCSTDVFYLSITPATNESGSSIITVTVADTESLTATQSFAVTVTAVNNAPIFTSSPIISATKDSDYAYTFSASDAESDGLVYSIITKPSWLSVQYEYGTINTIAGTGTGGFSGDGGIATSAQINGPFGVATDRSGNIYITEQNGHRIRKIDASTGNISTFAGTGTAGYSGDGGLATSAQIAIPLGIAVDSSDNIYFVHRSDNVIRRIDASTGIITTVAGNGTSGYAGDGGPATSAQLTSPYDVKIDRSGNIYITGDGDRVRKVDSSTGNISTIAGTTSGYSGDGGPATAAQLYNPDGIDVDSSGNVYIADTNGNRIRKIVYSTGFISTLSGDGSSGYSGDGGQATLAVLSVPYNLILDSFFNIYFSDAGNHVIRVINQDTGIINTIAGTGSNGFSGDGGSPDLAQLNYPIGLDIDHYNNIYIADKNNHRIRKVEILNIILSGTPLDIDIGDNAVTLEVSDGLASTTQSFTITVADTNDIPIISDISGQTINEDTTINSISFTATDAETAPCGLTVTVSSSNQILLPDANISYTCNANTYTVTATPVSDENGIATISVLVEDSGGLTAVTAFNLTVTALPDTPILSDFNALTTVYNTATEPINFTVTDSDGESLTLSALSSNINLVAIENMSFSGTGSSRTLTITPTTDEIGSLTITVIVSDSSGLTAQTEFALNVTPRLIRVSNIRCR
ncbi:hypothetical protein MHK_009516, partial [Candidatus Magnetomorum sp. HK-1]